MLRYEPSLGVLASGCSVAVNHTAYALYGDKLTAVPNVNEAITAAKSLLGVVGEASGASGMDLPANRMRLNLKIQDGCSEACTYCIVRHARGLSRSVPAGDVVAAAIAAELAGYREIVLTGVNIGSYCDLNAVDLVALLKELLTATQLTRYRLSSIEPNDVSNELIDLIARSEGRICAHLHLPLQSGSDTVLQAMRRPYTTAMYRARVAYARERLPNLALSTDVIVGFPGETEADFLKTYDFCKEMKYMRMHIFRYSIREGTEAAEMPDQIPSAVKAERSDALSQLAEQLTEADRQARTGTTEQALVERPGYARTDSYHLVKIPQSVKIGELIPICLTRREGRFLEATERNNAIQ
jgi:threonylcarbamoyladenosine tRNA methylthiotransferase MtaB